MGDDQHGRLAGDLDHHVTQSEFVGGVESGRRLVEEQQPGLAQQRAGDRHALALASGQP
ncbi:hypothetical protein QFZ43_008475 [Streptomyces afghaniensis]|nr:hypothetical protein [Streptomyces afghaniensis]